MPQGQVLVVDDDPDSLCMLEILLRAWDFGVVRAGNGAEALARLSSVPVDLVLTDLSMPQMDGAELARRLRANPQSARMPIIVVSGLHRLPQTLEGVVDAFVGKPADLERLRALISAHIQHAAK